MTLEQRVTVLAQTIAADVKALRIADGNLATLNTTAKNSFVAAINELFGMIGGSGVVIDDGAPGTSTTVAYSPNKITSLITNAINGVLGGAAAAYDTLSEIQSMLEGDDTAISGLLTAVGNRVAYDAAQSLTDPQKLQACNNIGVGNYDRNFATDYTTARDS